ELRLAFGVLHTHYGDIGALLVDRYGNTLHNGGREDKDTLSAKPGSGLQIGRQDLFQSTPGLAAHDVFPTSGPSNEWQLPPCDTGMFLCHSRRFEREPVEAVRPHCELVRALVDGWKGAAPEDLHRNASRKGGEVALEVLEKL